MKNLDTMIAMQKAIGEAMANVLSDFDVTTKDRARFGRLERSAIEF